MPVCPRCGASVDEGAGFCSKCGSVLRRGKLVAAPSPQSTPPLSTPWYLKPLPNCPKCGASVAANATVCSNCGSPLRPQQSMEASSPQPAPPRWYTSPQPSRGLGRSYFMYGIISAVVSLFFLSEIFGSVAIILGAHTWKKEEGNRGLTLIILGIICMLVGIYFTAYPLLIDLLLPA